VAEAAAQGEKEITRGDTSIFFQVSCNSILKKQQQRKE
jgi:hypothetical protein